MEAAPLFHDVADGPGGGAAYWLTASDGLRIRLGVWPEGRKGTVLIFPGRTEYVEKYGRAAAAFAAEGYASLAIDWRGQGIADRMLQDRQIGHVNRFRDYQMDVKAVMEAAQALDLPRPFFLLAHSMGGCIGLRAVMEGLDVKAAAFSAPMWGVQISVPLRPVAWTLSTILPPLGLGNIKSPGTNESVYVHEEPFEDNALTNDPEMWEYMARQTREYPDLALGPPSIIWLREALREMLHLASQPAPALPTICFLGHDERIVDPGRIKTRMTGWATGRLVEYEGAEHEVLMEVPKVRESVIAETVAHFEQSVTAQAA